MAPVRSPTFLCFLPLRIGAFVVSFVSVVVPGALSFDGWYHIVHLEDFEPSGSPLNLTQGQKFILLLHSLFWSLLCVFSVFGLYGILRRRPSIVSLYTKALAILLLSTMVSSTIYIVTLFSTQVVQQRLQSCETGSSSSACSQLFNLLRIVVISSCAAFWVFDLYGVYTLHRHSKQLLAGEQLVLEDYDEIKFNSRGRSRR